MSHSQTLGAGDALGAGDSYLLLDILPPELAAVAFDRVREEVRWDTMHHRGGEVPRLVAVEGEVGPDGSYPIYRHPSDTSPPLHPFSPTVAAIREHVQHALKHPVNHVLIQLYRNGADYISEHADKTIDVVRGSGVVNVSLGATRIMKLRVKKSSGAGAAAEGSGAPPPRETQRIPLPSNSMFVLGPLTNARWLHGIGRDGRSAGGERISLTFRHVGTFLSAEGRRIWGQGAVGKTREEARGVVHGPGEATEELLAAFGAENRLVDFDWEGWYGKGFDVVNFSTSGGEEDVE